MALSCNFCFKSFQSKKDLFVHLKSHVHKPFNCQYCDKSFTDARYLKVHQKKICASKNEEEILKRQQLQQPQYQLQQQQQYQLQQQQQPQQQPRQQQYQPLQQQQCQPLQQQYQLQQQCFQQQPLQQNFEVIDLTIQQDTGVQQERPLKDDGVSFSDSFGDFIDDGDIMITQEYHH